MCYASLPRTLCVPCTVRECLERKRVGWVGGWFRELSVSAIGEVTRPSSRGRTSELSTFDEGFEGGYFGKEKKIGSTEVITCGIVFLKTALSH